MNEEPSEGSCIKIPSYAQDISINNVVLSPGNALVFETYCKLIGLVPVKTPNGYYIASVFPLSDDAKKRLEKILDDIANNFSPSMTIEFISK
ncbi:hypothetical protein HYV57_04380 [Candidatus Peregrinibacteria bacterium]|nr:hypothetical protein [Candidatus Peregrinibacteria bacterium]